MPRAQIGMDPAEIRRRNLIPPSKLPYTTPTLWVYDSGEFERVMDKCVERQRLEGLRGARARVRRRTASCAAAR